MSDEVSGDEVMEAIEEMVAAGLAERVDIDGEALIRLTPAGLAAAERLATRLAESPSDNGTGKD